MKYYFMLNFCVSFGGSYIEIHLNTDKYRRYMKKIVLIILLFPAILSYGQQVISRPVSSPQAISLTELEDHFDLCLEFGAPREVVQLFQPFRTSKTELNGTISYVVQEDNSLLQQTPYSEYQMWYTIDKDLGLYQSSLFISGENSELQQILTSYLRRFSRLYGEPVYTNLDNGSILIFWYNENTYTLRARLLLDIVNPYKYVSITFCSPLERHTQLLTTLYGGILE